MNKKFKQKIKTSNETIEMHNIETKETFSTSTIQNENYFTELITNPSSHAFIHTSFM